MAPPTELQTIDQLTWIINSLGQIAQPLYGPGYVDNKERYSKSVIYVDCIGEMIYTSKFAYLLPKIRRSLPPINSIITGPIMCMFVNI